MFNVDEIYAMLQDGKTPDDIAQAALDAVNEAKARQEEEKRIEAEKAIQQKIDADKRRELDNALFDAIYAIIDYVALIDPELSETLCDAFDNLKDEEIADLHESFKALASMTVAFQKLDDILGDPSSKKLLGGTFANSLHADKIDKILNTAPGTGSKKIMSDDDVIANFIKMLG